jgi:hypothetical protein
MKNRYPTTAELYALEREARRMRAEYVSEMFRALAKGWQSFWSVKAVKGLRHA